MTPGPPAESRATVTGRTALRRLRDRVLRPHVVVGLVFGAGVTLALAAVVVLGAPGGSGAVLALGWLPAGVLAPLLVVLTLVSEWTFVRLRHGDTLEELTLLEAAIVVNVLLLPPAEALTVTAAGLTATYVLRRKPLIKSLFNVGSHLAGSAVLVVTVHTVAGGATTFSGPLLAGLLLGTLAFYVVNLVCLAAIFSAVEGTSPLEVMRREVRLSVVMAVGTVALGSTVVAMAIHTPLLVPFAALPAAALVYAYRAIAQEAEERGRSEQLVSFSHVLAAAPDRATAVDAFLTVAGDAFTGDETLVLFADGSVWVGATDDEPAGESPRALSPGMRVLRDMPIGGALVLEDGLPTGWRAALLAPLEAEGRRIGTVVLGSRRKGAFTTRDRTLLTPIVNALAVALVNADHLAELIAETTKLQAVVDDSSDGIVVLDGDGVVELWSPAAAGLAGRPEAEALGAPLSSVLDAREPDGGVVDAFARGRDQLTPASPTACVELPVLRPDGESRIVRCAYTATFAGDTPVRYVVLVHDLTRERQVDRLKADFIATVSHELRTPVTPIKGYADLLRRRGDELTPEKRAQCLDTIVDRASHLARLVEDLLLASRMNDDEEPRRRVDTGAADLTALVRRTTEDFRDGAARLWLDLPDGPVPVVCDVTRTVQVLTNLVGNALKYSPPDAPVEVAVGTDGTRAWATVTDHGRGLPEDQLDRIFEKFHRVEEPDVMTTSGTGLGLFIARSLARAMGGDITVRSVLGVGSTFTFDLGCVGDGVEAARGDGERSGAVVPSGPPPWSLRPWARPRALPGTSPSRGLSAGTSPSGTSVPAETDVHPARAGVPAP